MLHASAGLMWKGGAGVEEQYAHFSIIASTRLRDKIIGTSSANTRNYSPGSSSLEIPVIVKRFYHQNLPPYLFCDAISARA